jgi:hypothetical protein
MSLPGYNIHTPIVKARLPLNGPALFAQKNEVCKPLQNQQNDLCRHFMIRHVFVQQHTGLDIIVCSPMFPNKEGKVKKQQHCLKRGRGKETTALFEKRER